MNESRNFQAPDLDLTALAQALTQWYQQQQFEVQTIPIPDGLMMQARQFEGWRKALGVSSALQIVFHQRPNELTVEMGAAKWSDKAAAGAVGWFLLWPLAFTAAYGAWQQSKLPERTFEFIQQYLTGGLPGTPTWRAPGAATAPSMPEAPAPAMSAAPPAGGTAQAPAPAPAAELAGAQPSEGATFCSHCGNQLQPDMLFCPKCGTKVGG